MSYVEVLILSHLAKEPSHGYELRRRVEATTGFGLHNNSLYPALRRFGEAGAVTKAVEPQDGGRRLLHDMLAELPADQAGDEAEFLARVGQFELLTPPERCAVLDARLGALTGRAAHLAGLEQASSDHPWGAMVVRELLRRTAAERRWLTSLRALGGELPPLEKGDQP